MTSYYYFSAHFFFIIYKLSDKLWHYMRMNFLFLAVLLHWLVVIQITNSNWWRSRQSATNKRSEEKKLQNLYEEPLRSWANRKYEHKWNVFERDYKENYSSSCTLSIWQEYAFVCCWIPSRCHIYNIHIFTFTYTHVKYPVIFFDCRKNAGRTHKIPNQN